MGSKSERLDILFDSLGTRKPYSQVLDGIENTHEQMRDERGRESEKKFEEFAQRYFGWMLNNVRKTPRKVDIEQGIDYILDLNNQDILEHMRRSSLPVQVKSSDKGVEAFRNGKHYSDLGKRIMVINAAPNVKMSKFKKDFWGEIKRIKKLTET